MKDFQFFLFGNSSPEILMYFQFHEKVEAAKTWCDYRKISSIHDSGELLLLERRRMVSS